MIIVRFPFDRYQYPYYRSSQAWPDETRDTRAYPQNYVAFRNIIIACVSDRSREVTPVRGIVRGVTL